MDNAVELAAPGSTTLRYRVGGMDCPSCAGKIETALRRLSAKGRKDSGCVTIRQPRPGKSWSRHQRCARRGPRPTEPGGRGGWKTPQQIPSRAITALSRLGRQRIPKPAYRVPTITPKSFSISQQTC
jgi:hypothetical protein